MPLVEPFVITMPEGVVRLVLLLLSATTLQPTDALFKLTVQVVEEPPTKLPETQLTELGVTAETRLIVAVAELLPRVAVRIALWSLATLTVLPTKTVDMAAEATVTEAGMERVGLVLDRATTAPPAGAALVRVTVQVLEELDPRLVGLQTRLETSTGATRLRVVLAELLL